MNCGCSKVIFVGRTSPIYFPFLLHGRWSRLFCLVAAKKTNTPRFLRSHFVLLCQKLTQWCIPRSSRVLLCGPSLFNVLAPIGKHKPDNYGVRDCSVLTLTAVRNAFQCGSLLSLSRVSLFVLLNWHCVFRGRFEASSSS